MATSRPHFDATVDILELINIPQSTGQVVAKWYIKDSPRPESRGKSHAVSIKDHKVAWNYKLGVRVRMGLDRHQVLRNCILVVELIWEYAGNSRVTMGKVEINLSEHVGREPSVTRYLLRDSKVNSILSARVSLEQTRGTTDYSVPEFSTPQIFGDITGVIDERKNRHDRDYYKTDFFSKLYHRTYAISWDLRPGELDPDACIEDIFCGGDGFGPDWETIVGPINSIPAQSNGNSNSNNNDDDDGDISSGEKRRRERDQRHLSNSRSAKGSTGDARSKRASGEDDDSQRGRDFSGENGSINSSDLLLRDYEERDDFKSWRT